MCTKSKKVARLFYTVYTVPKYQFRENLRKIAQMRNRSSTIFAHSDFLAVFICFDAGFWDCARPHITHRFLNLMETPPRETRRQSHATDENSLREPLRGNEKKTASIAAFLGEGIFTMGYSKKYI